MYNILVCNLQQMLKKIDATDVIHHFMFQEGRHYKDFNMIRYTIWDIRVIPA